MSARNGSRLALLGWAACLVLAVGAIVFYGLSSSVEPIREFGARQTHVGLALAFLAYATVGALVVFRRPENRIGWLLLLVALGMEIEVLVTEYAAYALVAQPGALPGGEIAAWLAWWIWVPSLVLATTFLFLLFPNGRLLSRRWVAVVVLAAVAGTLGTVTGALSPGPVDFLEAVDIENHLRRGPSGRCRDAHRLALSARRCHLGGLPSPPLQTLARRGAPPAEVVRRHGRPPGHDVERKLLVGGLLVHRHLRDGRGLGPRPRSDPDLLERDHDSEVEPGQQRRERSRSRWPFLSTGSTRSI